MPFTGRQAFTAQQYYPPGFGELELNAAAMPLAPGVTSAVFSLEGFASWTLFFLITQNAAISLVSLAEDDTTALTKAVIVPAAVLSANWQFFNVGTFSVTTLVPFVWKKIQVNFTAAVVAGVVTARIFARA